MKTNMKTTNKLVEEMADIHTLKLHVKMQTHIHWEAGVSRAHHHHRHHQHHQHHRHHHTMNGTLAM